MRVCYVSTRMLFDTTARETARERMRVLCTRDEDESCTVFRCAMLVSCGDLIHVHHPPQLGSVRSLCAHSANYTGAHDDSRRDLFCVCARV